MKNKLNEFSKYMKNAKMEKYLTCYLEMEHAQKEEMMNVLVQYISGKTALKDLQLSTLKKVNKLIGMVQEKKERTKEYEEEEEDAIGSLKDDLVSILVKKLNDYWIENPNDDDRKVNVLGSPVYNRKGTKPNIIIIPPTKGDAWSDTVEETPGFNKQTINDIDMPIREIVNCGVLDDDYHIEFGDNNAPEFPDLTILHKSKNICHYYQFLKRLDHDNFIGIPQGENSEDQGPTVISVQKDKNKKKKPIC